MYRASEHKYEPDTITFLSNFTSIFLRHIQKKIHGKILFSGLGPQILIPGIHPSPIFSYELFETNTSQVGIRLPKILTKVNYISIIIKIHSF